MEMNQVAIPHDYFYKMSKKDYSYIHEALVREFFQNSRDAGATQFDMAFSEQVKYVPMEDYATANSDKHIDISEDTHSFWLTVTDNGCGMDKDTILTKLLVLGKSGKDAQHGAVGVMGHAKLLLYFSWEQWTIRTGNIEVQGKGHYYNIVQKDTFVKGVVSTIKLPDQSTYNNVQWAVRDYFRYCDTGVDVRLKEGSCSEYKKIEQNLRTTRLVEDGFAPYDVYESIHKSFYIVVRQNGVMMFKTWMGSTEQPTPVVEVKVSALDAFLQNRDYFKHPYNEEYSKLVNTFQTDSLQTYSKQADKFGTKEINVENRVEGRVLSQRALLVNDMTKKSHENFLKTKRSQRLINIVEGFYDLFSSKVVGLPNHHGIKFGVTFDESTRGYASTKGDGVEVMLNLTQIVQRSTNHRHMAINLYNLMVHELGHVLSIARNEAVSHDEKFATNMAEIYDKAWDQLDFITAFKHIWQNGILIIREDS